MRLVAVCVHSSQQDGFGFWEANTVGEGVGHTQKDGNVFNKLKWPFLGKHRYTVSGGLKCLHACFYAAFIWAIYKS